MSDFKPGDIVDITIKGVRIDEEHTDGTVTIVAEHPDGKPAHWQMPPQAAVERVAPAEWPPRAGDLWKDRDGDLWFAFLVDTDNTADETYVELQPGRSSKHPGSYIADLETLGHWHGPFTLVHREEGETDG